MKSSPTSWQGPPLVALGAFLWATDSIFRSDVVKSYSPLFIVFLNHALCLVVALPTLLARPRVFRGISRRDVFALAFIATLGSALAAVMFTRAFATTSNFTTPILIQKLQPLFAITLAHLILKEQLNRRFALWATLATFGAFLVTFGWTPPWQLIATGEAEPALYALGAAAIWGATTVFGRQLLAERDFVFVTAARFTFAAVFIAMLVAMTEGFGAMPMALSNDLGPFLGMAFVSGLAPLALYYLGLKTTPASVATLCELAFPLAAILLNWIVLDSPLGPAQLAGAAILLAAITALTLENASQKGTGTSLS